MLTTVLFDLDGTLLDTLDDLTAAVGHMLSSFGFTGRTRDEVRRFVGNGIQKLVLRSLPDDIKQGMSEPPQKYLSCFHDYYAAHLQDRTAPYDGITDLLRALRQRGFKTGIVSNKTDAAVKKLSEDYFSGLYDVAIGESICTRRKPAPDAVRQALDRLHSSENECVYIGDSEVDIQTAKNACVNCISVTWGFRDAAYLLQNGAKALVHTPQELTDILLNQRNINIG